MPERSFPDALNDQIANEFGAAMQYIGAAVYYDSETLPRLAGVLLPPGARGARATR